ncbi:hypothetical protein Hanom_Chr12g01156271 [Helianthus anomalus]
MPAVLIEVEVLSSEGTPPTQNVELLFKDLAGEAIVDTLDASGNLIDPRYGGEDKGDKKQKSPTQENVSSSDGAGKGDEEQPPIQPHEMEQDYYYRTYSRVRCLCIHSPPCNILQGDDVMTNLSLCGEALRRLGHPSEAARIRDFGHENFAASAYEEESARLKEEAVVLMKKAQADEERLAKQKAGFEAYKQTEQWAIAAGHKQVGSLTNILAEERKLEGSLHERE